MELISKICCVANSEFPNQVRQALVILFRPFGFLVHKDYYIICLYNVLIFSVVCTKFDIYGFFLLET